MSQYRQFGFSSVLSDSASSEREYPPSVDWVLWGGFAGGKEESSSKLFKLAWLSKTCKLKMLL